MNRTLVTAAWRERFSQPLVLGLLVVASLVLLSPIAFTAEEDLQDPSASFTLILGAGLVGRDVSSGALALLFIRPIKRSHYVLAKWLAVGLAAGGLSAFHLVLQFAVASARAKGVPASELLTATVEGLAIAFGLSAVLAPLSVLVPGLGDIGLWFMMMVVVLAAKLADVPQWATQFAGELLLPQIDWGWPSLVSYASNVTFCLALAAWLINRKEVSYASG